VARMHDLYMGSHFLPVLFRREKISAEQFETGQKWINKTLDALEHLRTTTPPPGYSYFWGGDAVSLADISLAPTFVYLLLCEENLKIRKDDSLFGGRPFLQQWWLFLNNNDKIWQRIYKEMMSTKHDMFSGRV